MKKELVRREDWDTRMYSTIVEWEQKEFEYGTSDCCAFAGAVVGAMTDTNPWADWAGKYNDAETAQKILEVRGCRNLYQALVTTLGKSRPIAMAQRGDVVYGSNSKIDFAQVGICLGIMSVSWGGEGGMIQVSTLQLKRSFRI